MAATGKTSLSPKRNRSVPRFDITRGTWRSRKWPNPSNNIIVVPQYALWFTMPEEEPEYEDIEEIDEDAVSGLSKVSDDDSNKSDDEVDSNLKDSEDELDCFY